MTLVNIEKDTAASTFALAAANDFHDNPSHYVYSEGDPKPGEHLAIRWNSFTVLVVILDENEMVRLFQTHDLIQSDLPPLNPVKY